MNRIVCYMIFLSIVALSSCQEFNKIVYEEYHTFEKLSWNRFDILTFSTELEKVETPYDVILNIRHLPQIKYKQLEINLTIYTASGDMRSTEYTLDFYDNDGKKLSDCMGEYCDLRTPLREAFLFYEPGTVRFEIENKHTKLEMPGILEVGLILRESKQEKSE